MQPKQVLMDWYYITCQIYYYFLGKNAKEHQLLGCHLHGGGHSGTAGRHQHPAVVPEPAKWLFCNIFNDNSLCKPSLFYPWHSWRRHQLCSDLHPTAFLTIVSFPLCFFFFNLVLLGSPNTGAWTIPLQNMVTVWLPKRTEAMPGGGNIWNKRTTDNHYYISSVHHFLSCASNQWPYTIQIPYRL